MSEKEHIHYWLCEPPNGVYSKAKCKYCSEEAKFRNSPEHVTAWRRSLSSKQAKMSEGHGLTKTQLEKELAKKGEKMPNFPRVLESKTTKKE